MSAAAFYCVADERYFLGAVGMVNSLRLVGHAEPIHLLDCGLTAAQRELLETEVEVIEAPADGTPPWLLKTHAPLARPSAVSVLIDTDMIVTRRLDPLLEAAGSGGVAAFCDRQRRYFADWGELLDLEPSTPGPYVSSGLVALGGEAREPVLRLWDDRQHRVDFELTFWRQNVRDYAFRYADQDVLNAILATRAERRRLTALDERLAATPPFRGLRIDDPGTLRCSYRDGAEPFLLHQYVRKPWLEPMYHGIWPRLFVRCLLANDVAIRVPPEALPRRMRGGLRGRAERAVVDAADLGRWYLLERLPARLRGR